MIEKQHCSHDNYIEKYEKTLNEGWEGWGWMAVEGSESYPTLTGFHSAMGPPVGTADAICSFAYEFVKKGFLRLYFLGAGFVKGGVSALAVDA